MAQGDSMHAQLPAAGASSQQVRAVAVIAAVSAVAGGSLLVPQRLASFAHVLAYAGAEICGNWVQFL